VETWILFLYDLVKSSHLYALAPIKGLAENTIVSKVKRLERNIGLVPIFVSLSEVAN
jgi:hypothetical protein